jgi:hypothetical protein
VVWVYGGGGRLDASRWSGSGGSGSGVGNGRRCGRRSGGRGRCHHLESNKTS